MNDKIREEFEREWGQVDAEQGVHFIPELNTYGSELYAQHGYAQMKSSAWFYFQKGWKESRATLVVELPPLPEVPEDPEEAIDDSHMDAYYSALGMRNACAQFVEAAGLKVAP